MNNLIKIIIAIALVPVVLYFWPTSLGGDTTIMIVQGNSMLPTILPGSLVVAKTASEYNVDDIVAYEANYNGAKKIVVHRIIEERDNGSFVIQGDNNPKKDAGYPTEDMILGTVAFSTPYMGDALSLLRNPIFLVFAAGAVFAVQSVQKTRKERREKMRYRRLGLPVPKKTKPVKKTPKKPDYSMFYAAIMFNVIISASLFVLIENEIVPEGDAVTGFMYNSIKAHVATILISAFYFGIIFGLYILARKHQKKLDRRLAVAAYYGQSVSLLKKKQQNIMLSLASVGWLLFILLSLFHLMSIGKDLIPIIT